MLRSKYVIAVMSMMLLTNMAVRAGSWKCWLGWGDPKECEAEKVCDVLQKMPEDKRRVVLTYITFVRQLHHKGKAWQFLQTKFHAAIYECNRVLEMYLNNNLDKSIFDADIEKAKTLRAQERQEWEEYLNVSEKVHDVLCIKTLEEFFLIEKEFFFDKNVKKAAGSHEICKKCFREEAKKLNIEWVEKIAATK